ncbi:hypothetical protein, partial [Pasteurella multocida]
SQCYNSAATKETKGFVVVPSLISQCYNAPSAINEAYLVVVPSLISQCYNLVSLIPYGTRDKGIFNAQKLLEFSILSILFLENFS